VIIFYGDCAFASSPGTITSPFVRFRSLGDSFFHKEGDGILATFATGLFCIKKHPENSGCHLFETKPLCFLMGLRVKEPSGDLSRVPRRKATANRASCSGPTKNTDISIGAIYLEPSLLFLMGVEFGANSK